MVRLKLPHNYLVFNRKLQSLRGCISDLQLEGDTENSSSHFSRRPAQCERASKTMYMYSPWVAFCYTCTEIGD
eukprot:3797157-Prymnesium_polylepis.1